MRSDIVPDTIPYRDMFMGLYDYSSTIENGYLWFCSLFYRWRFSFQGYLFVWAFFSLVIWWKCTIRVTKSDNIFWPLMLFMSYMGIYNYGIIIRAATALTIIYVALTYYLCSESRFRLFVYWGLCFVAMQFHQTVFIYLVIPFICKKVYPKSILYTVLCLSLLLSFSVELFQSQQKVLSLVFDKLGNMGYLTRLNSYVERSEDALAFSFSFTQLKFCIFALFFVYIRKFIDNEKITNGYNFFLNIYVVGVLLYALFSYIMAGVRLSYLLLFFEFILATIVVLYINKRNLRAVTFLVVVLVNYIILYAHVPKLLYYIE